MQASGKLSFDGPTEDSGAAFDEYVSDPNHPLPYRNRPIPSTYGGPGWPTWLVNDQRFTDSRQDVLRWQTAPLDREVVTVSGDIVAQFFAATPGTYSDWIIKLIDGYPHTDAKDPPMGGYELTIARDLLRGRFREGYEHPKQCKRTRLPDTGSICSRIIRLF